MPRGGKREGAGRPAGAPNKATREIKELAAQHGPAMIRRLVELATGATAESTQVSAIKELLDRGFGKAAQPQTGPDGESSPVIEVVYRWAAQSDD